MERVIISPIKGRTGSYIFNVEIDGVDSPMCRVLVDWVAAATEGTVTMERTIRDSDGKTLYMKSGEVRIEKILFRFSHWVLIGNAIIFSQK